MTSKPSSGDTSATSSAPQEPDRPEPDRAHLERPGSPRPISVVVAVLGMAVVLVALLVVVVGVLAQGHGRFSLGIGVMLAIYAASMAVAAWAGWRVHRLAYGAMMGLSVVNAFVVASTANSSHALWLWPLLLPVLVTIGALLTRSARAAFGRLDVAQD